MEFTENKIDRLYNELIEPSNFIRNFKNINEFKEWLKLGNKEDCVETLKAFAKSELYEICIIINEHINKM